LKVHKCNTCFLKYLYVKEKKTLNTSNNKYIANIWEGLNMKINVPIKTCKRCGEKFVVGYYASVGIQFWLTLLTFIGGIIYWAVRGRGERCPKCKNREFEVKYMEIEV